ncbi:MAG: heparinase II/III-family protein [Armatimonadetes bacterium]|nr:heparinase II/III-family protein [Armatimonadota bacterium]
MQLSYFLVVTLLMLASSAPASTVEGSKRYSVFFPPELVARARKNVSKYQWMAGQKNAIIKAAQPWLKMSDDELWALMFGPTIHRAWHVLSDGNCPACKKPVPMYGWRHDALNHPWKVQCPHCKEFFPKNDFYKFYLSGLDEHGIFDPKRADRTLLFNTEHPNPDDPLHKFGVDDGTGYVEGGRKWQFIGAYLIYGQWKQAVLGGIRNLAAAYVVTGDRRYAHKAAILLDRVADLYPTFDFMSQADLYDGRNQGNGYVSVWHDACEETRELAMAYDMISAAIFEDRKLIEFLSQKAKLFGISSRKTSAEDICRNIEDRILRDALANPAKIHSNYPRAEITKIVIMAILGWPTNKDQVMAIFDAMMERATAVDGVTGEKGLFGYSAITIQSVAGLLEQFSRIDSSFLADALRRHPRIRDMFRFHIDTWCMKEYYPCVGDAGSFARKCTSYVGVIFSKDPAAGSMWTFALTPSMFSFLWRLYEVTGDANFVKVLYHANENKLENLPYDLFCDAPEAFQRDVRNVIARVGPTIEQKSVNKKEWHIAILRSGTGKNARAAWLLYDSMGGHGHANHMHLGLFAKGLDLLPDFGYKPVQFGGWGSPRAMWYGMAAAHNTVVVDGKDHAGGAGTSTLWADGAEFHAIRATGGEPVGTRRFERLIALVDISETSFYIFDVFRVFGGSDHAKFTGSHFGTISTDGLSLKPAPDYGYGTQMRNFQVDSNPQIPWSVDWKIEDKYEYLPKNSDIHFRYTDLTYGAEAYVAEAWVALGISTTADAWIPRIITRRRSTARDLSSTFVAVMEPYESRSAIKEIRRLFLSDAKGEPCSDNQVAVEILLADGSRDLITSLDIENTHRILVQKEWDMQTDAELCMVRQDEKGKIRKIIVCKGSFLEVDGVKIAFNGKPEFIELAIDESKALLISGDAEDIKTTSLNVIK